MEFYNTKGQLTAYGFSCGYVESKRGKKTHAQMYKEHNTYHVRAGNNGERVHTWECFETLTPARKLYNKLEKEVN
jgi:hypothetical protein